MDEQLLRQRIANNLLYFRKKTSLTQYELAEKLNYSDKSVSKWERAEGVPDIYVLFKISEIFGITIAQLLGETPKKAYIPARKKDIISFLSAGIVWLTAVVVYVTLGIFAKELPKTWLAFIYAVPISSIVLFIFNKLWKRHLISFLLVSLMFWSIILSLYLSFSLENIWLLFFVGIPLQIMTVLWFLLKR